MSERINARIFGPKPAAADVEGAGFIVSPETSKKLIELFTHHLSTHRTGPVQMMVEAPDMPASVVNVFRYYGMAAVAHVLRTPPEGDVPAMAGIIAVLPGVDPDAEEAAIAAIEKSRDKTGKPLPLPPKVYDALRADARPLMAMLLFTEEAVKDVSLRLLAVCLSKAFLASIRNAPAKQKAPGDGAPGA